MNKGILLALLSCLVLFLSACGQSSEPSQPKEPIEPTKPSGPSAPELLDVSLREERDAQGNKEIAIDIQFQDLDGDANGVNYEILETTQEGVSFPNRSLRTGFYQVNSFAMKAATWNCEGETYTVDLGLTIVDQKELESNSKVVTIVCD